MTDTRVVQTLIAAAGATVRIVGVDDRGVESDGIGITIGAGEATTLTAEELEAGGGGMASGNGSGKWQLFVNADRRVLVQSLLESETGHLSTSTVVADFQLPSADVPTNGVAATGNFALDYADVGDTFPWG